MSGLPIPTGTPSHLDRIFSRMYSPYSRDPRALGSIEWSVAPGSTNNQAYVTISGATASLVVSKTGSQAQYDYNLADGIPTIDNFKTWLTSQLNLFFGSGVTVIWSTGFTGLTNYSSLAAIGIPEGFYQSGESITYATSFNYRTMRVASLLYDLMSADTSNMYGHLSVAGAQGMWLDWIGAFYQVPIFTGEDPDGYRRRVLRTLAQPKENNVAIAQLVSESFGVANVLALDYTLFRCILYVFGSLSQPTLVMPYVRSIAPAGIIWTGIEIPPGGELVGALAGHTVAGTLSDRPVSTTMSDTGRSFLAMPLSGIFAILR